MNFEEYKSQFENEEDAITQLNKDITEAFVNNSDKITISPNAQGHTTFLNKDQEFKSIHLENYVNHIVNDIRHQYEINNFFSDLPSPEEGKAPIPLFSIDIDQILSGNIEWKPGTVCNPDTSLVSCSNDGKKYVVNMKDWKINFYDYESFIFQRKLVEIEPFKYNKSLVHSTIDFPSGDLVAFNYLPRELDDYIESHFTQSQYGFKGRNWDKFLGEILLSANVLRTPTHIGGKVFQNDNNIITGGNNEPDEEESIKYIGETNNDVWQTLIADKKSLEILFMNALKINKQKAIEHITALIEEQSGVEIKIASGHYNVYYFPKMNSCLDEDRNALFSDFCEQNQLNNNVNPDMIITQETIQPPFLLDDKTIVKQEEKEAFKMILSVKNSKNDLSL